MSIFGSDILWFGWFWFNAGSALAADETVALAFFTTQVATGKEIYRGAEYVVDFIPKVKLEIIIDAAQVDQVVTKIKESVYTGKIGDGKIFVLSV